ncbi:uncharacterized protein LOC123685743 [Harmonia axyridis]|uniref:uncharacterized protein LOC123685743 n=1 Tax=Harmonia axyridis TaxID=115357 RepID=UPI001E275B9B|nr:uncharacterized protein LOC123685743 [Harmonia axyridis]
MTEALKLRRAQIKAHLMRFSDFLSNLSDSDESGKMDSQIKSRLEKLKSLYDTFDQIQSSIELETGHIEYDERAYFEENYFCLEAQALDLIAKHSALESGSVYSNNPMSSLKLPPLTVPDFHGSCTQRYDNKRVIIHTHLKLILELPPVEHESHFYLRKLLDNFNENIRSLKALDQPIELWDTLLVYILSSKLDSVTKKEWEQFANTNLDEKTLPTMSELTDFLSRRCQLLEIREHKNKTLTKSYRKHIIYSNLPTQKQTCSFCKKNHSHYRCQKFLEMSLNERLEEVRRTKICTNCLGNNHLISNCKSIYNCRICKKRHNTLLHDNEKCPNFSVTDFTDASGN